MAANPNISVPYFKNSEEAVAFGIAATQAQIVEIMEARNTTLEMLDDIKYAEDPDTAMRWAVTAQFFREAIDAYFNSH